MSGGVQDRSPKVVDQVIHPGVVQSPFQALTQQLVEFVTVAQTFEQPMGPPHAVAGEVDGEGVGRDGLAETAPCAAQHRGGRGPVEAGRVDESVRVRLAVVGNQVCDPAVATHRQPLRPLHTHLAQPVCGQCCAPAVESVGEEPDRLSGEPFHLNCWVLVTLAVSDEGSQPHQPLQDHAGPVLRSALQRLIDQGEQQ